MVVYESFFALYTFFLGSKRSKANQTNHMCKRTTSSKTHEIRVVHHSTPNTTYQTARGNQQHTPNSILSVSQYSILCGFIYLHENRHQTLREIGKNTREEPSEPPTPIPSKHKARIKCHKPNDHHRFFPFSFSFSTFPDAVFCFFFVCCSSSSHLSQSN